MDSHCNMLAGSQHAGWEILGDEVQTSKVPKVEKQVGGINRGAKISMAACFNFYLPRFFFCFFLLSLFPTQ